VERFKFPYTGTLPSVGDLTDLRGTLLLGFGFRGLQPRSRPVRALLIVLVRSVSIAVRNYHAAEVRVTRLSAENERGGGELGIEISDELEISLVFARRALDAATRLVHSREAPMIQRDLRNSIEKLEKEAVQVRDAVVHIAEWCADGKLGDEDIPTLLLTSDATEIELGGCIVRTADYARLLRRLHGVAEASLEELLRESEARRASAQDA
jgi:hypothetical protein